MAVVVFGRQFGRLKLPFFFTPPKESLGSRTWQKMQHWSPAVFKKNNKKSTLVKSLLICPTVGNIRKRSVPFDGHSFSQKNASCFWPSVGDCASPKMMKSDDNLALENLYSCGPYPSCWQHWVLSSYVPHRPLQFNTEFHCILLWKKSDNESRFFFKPSPFQEPYQEPYQRLHIFGNAELVECVLNPKFRSST